MGSLNLFETFSEFKELKNIDRATMMRVLEDVFKSTLLKQFGNIDNLDIIKLHVGNDPYNAFTLSGAKSMKFGTLNAGNFSAVGSVQFTVNIGAIYYLGGTKSHSDWSR